jgi:hypothetical protein
LTPAELFLMVDSYKEQMEARRDELITHAWMTIALDRTKRLPALDSLIKTEKPVKTKEELKADWEELNKRFPALGGERFGK